MRATCARQRQRLGVSRESDICATRLPCASPRAARPRVDVEMAVAAVQLQATHGWVPLQVGEHTALFASDAEVGCIAGQVLRVCRATDPGVVGSAAAGGIDLHRTEDGRHLVDDRAQPTV